MSLRRRVADWIAPSEVPPLPTPMRVVTDRQEAALSLMDEECMGFVLVQVRDGSPVTVTIAGSVEPEHEAAVGTTLRDVARMAYGVR